MYTYRQKATRVSCTRRGSSPFGRTC